MAVIRSRPLLLFSSAGVSSAASESSDYRMTQPVIANVAGTITPKALTTSASIGGTLTKSYDGTTNTTTYTTN